MPNNHTISLFTLTISTLLISVGLNSCVKKYDNDIQLSLSEDFLSYRGEDIEDSLVITRPSVGDIYIQNIYKDPITGLVEIIDSKLISVENTSEYDPTYSESNGYTPISTHKKYSHELISNGSTTSTMVYHSTYLSKNNGLRINLETLTEVTSIDIFQQSTTIDKAFYFSVKGSIYSYNPTSNSTELLLNTGYTSLANISFSPNSNRIYYTAPDESSKEVMYYDIGSKSKKVAYTSNYGIKYVKAIGNSDSYLYTDSEGKGYIRNDSYLEEIEKRESETIIEAAATYTNNTYTKFFYVFIPNWTTWSPSRFRKQVGSEQYTAIQNETPSENLIISNDGNSYLYINNSLIINSNKEDNYISNVVDADFNTEDNILYVKDGNIFSTNTEANSKTLQLEYTSDIEHVTW